MPKSKLPPEKQLIELNNIKKIYSLTDTPYSIPHKLYHYFPKNAKQIPKELQKVKQNGLHNSSSRPDTSFIDNKINRPPGNYFWGTEIKPEVNLEVNISDLNLKHLYAFPHQIADKILNWRNNYQVPAQFWTNLDKLTKAVPFSDYKGQFKAEFIYTLPISPEKITINHYHKLPIQ